MEKRQTNFYLVESVRQWIAEEAKKQKISQSCFIQTLIKTAMSENEIKDRKIAENE